MRTLIIIFLILICGCSITKPKNVIGEFPEFETKLQKEKKQFKILSGEKFPDKAFKVNADFKDLSASNVILFFMDLIHARYVLSGNFDRTIMISIHGLYKESEIINMLKNILNANGYDVVQKNNAYLFYQINKDDNDNSIYIQGDEDKSKSVYTYKMQYVPVASIYDTLKNMFKDSEIIINDSLNLVVIKAKEPDYKNIRLTLDRFDKRPKQIIVGMVILEVEINDSIRHGVEYFLKDVNKGGNILASLLPDNFATGTDLLQGGVKYFTTHNNTDVIIELLNIVSNVKIISKPKIIVEDKKHGTIKIGREEPIQKGTTVASTGVSTTQIDYRDVGLILDVGVHVEENNVVRLKLKQELSSIVTDSNLLIASPSFTQKTIDMEFNVTAGENIFVGGLIQTEDTFRTKKIPFLGSLPYIGTMFSSQEKIKKETELIMIVNVELLQTDEDIYQYTNPLQQKIKGV